MASGPPQTELRLVLLGGTRAGQSAAGNAILGRQAFLTQTASEPAVTQECEKHRGTIAGRWVSVVVAQDWFCSERPLEEVRHHVSSCVALSAPGPHAFLLCVPVDRPADMELRALEALEKVLAPLQSVDTPWSSSPTQTRWFWDNSWTSTSPPDAKTYWSWW
uniref:AIG1-type G domain-containing protein n=1 Tax=Oncorhynchus tshawytscha TaxID=74940 RepID=A0AAZ3RAX4_ONCTS